MVNRKECVKDVALLTRGMEDDNGGARDEIVSLLTLVILIRH